MPGDETQDADWRNGSHMPVIECPEAVTAGQMFEVKAGLDKAMAHPNTREHQIRWITLFFHPEGANFVADVGHFELNGYSESAKGGNRGLYDQHGVTAWMTIDEPGTLYALAFCSIHALWKSSKAIRLT